MDGTESTEFAEELIRRHTDERAWHIVEEDFRWLGQMLEQQEVNRRVAVLSEHRDELEEWLRRQPPVNIWVMRDPGNADVEVMVTHWPDGTATLAYRDLTQSRTWGPPHQMDSRPVT